VMFPRTWAKVQDVVHENAVVLVGGKLDLSRGDPQIIVETATQQIDAFLADLPVDDVPPPVSAWLSAPEDEPDLAGGPVWSPPPAAPEPPPAPVWDGAVSSSSAEPPGFGDLPPEWALDMAAAPPPAPVRPITITFVRNGDAARDERRFRRLMNTLHQFPGSDPYLVVLVSPDGGRYEMRFPSTTRCCDDLLMALGEIVGPDHVSVGDEAESRSGV
ncbi:MAG: hypothetical protein JNL34_06305, partial [Anaerolineae bacterium]|nr:hypothetical protein [Anaerolineae bacterium]